MLAALLAAFLLFMSGDNGLAVELFNKDIQDSVKEVVADAARADRAAAVMKQGRKDLKDLGRDLEKIAKGFRAKDKDSAAGLAALTPFIEQAIEVRRRGQTVVLNRLFELRGTLSESEWEAALSSLAKEP